MKWNQLELPCHGHVDDWTDILPRSRNTRSSCNRYNWPHRVAPGIRIALPPLTPAAKHPLHSHKQENRIRIRIQEIMCHIIIQYTHSIWVVQVQWMWTQMECRLNELTFRPCFGPRSSPFWWRIRLWAFLGPTVRVHVVRTPRNSRNRKETKKQCGFLDSYRMSSRSNKGKVFLERQSRERNCEVWFILGFFIFIYLFSPLFFFPLPLSLSLHTHTHKNTVFGALVLRLSLSLSLLHSLSISFQSDSSIFLCVCVFYVGGLYTRQREKKSPKIFMER